MTSAFLDEEEMKGRQSVSQPNRERDRERGGGREREKG